MLAELKNSPLLILIYVNAILELCEYFAENLAIEKKGIAGMLAKIEEGSGQVSKLTRYSIPKTESCGFES
ncbi:MAG: hypothetical protein OXI60_02730 [Acidiferrobacterales bacterium]|nr:hypothetical protein [Acidiferrobacterales bacterium]